MDNVQLNQPDTLGAVIATDDILGVQHQLLKMEYGDDGAATMVSPTNPLPVTDATLAAKDFATQTTLAAVLAKLSSDPATQTTLAAILAKLITTPATEAKQDIGNTSLGSIDGKLPALSGGRVPVAAIIAGEVEIVNDTGNPIPVNGSVSVGNFPATQPVSNAGLTNLDVLLSTRTKPADQQHTIVDSGTLTAVTAITNALPAGSNIIGKVSIDQTTPGTTNGVVVNSIQDASASGTISAADVVAGTPGEDGVPVTGVPTANSAVFCACPGGDSGFTIQLLGTVAGTYYFEASFDSTNGTDGNWVVTKLKQTGKLDEMVSWKTTIKGVYRGNLSTAKYIRVRNVGGSSFSTTVVIRVSVGTGGTFLMAPIPEGTKNIGRVSIAEILPPNLQQLAIEGYPIIGFLQQAAGGFIEISAGGTILSGTIKFCDLGAGKAAWVEEIVITSAGGTGITWANVLNTGPFTWDPATETMYGDIPIDGGVVVQKVQRFMIEGSNLVVNITNIDTGRKQRLTVAVRGIAFTDDFNFDAKTLALMVGTSNDYNNMGIDPATTLRYRNEWIHMWQVRDKMHDAGKSVRIINKSVVASDSDQWAKALTSGIFGGTNYDLLVINLCINDGLTGSGITTTQFETNLKKFITHRNRYRPEASIIFMDATPTDRPDRSGIAPYRTSVQTVANDATLGTTARRVYFCGVFAAWVAATGQATGLNPTATADLNFNDAERVAGSRIHQSGAGMTITANALWATIQTTHYYQKLA